jgi:DNA-binding response OmpR family regulator
MNQINATIMVIDDTPDQLFLLKGMLQNKGYTVLDFLDGKTALKATEETQPDLIMLDIVMPVMDGFEVCRRLKKDQKTKEIPVLFISSLDETADKVKAFQVGGVDYVSKPFQFAEVYARIKTHLELKQARENLERIVAERTVELKRKVNELEARDRLVSIQMKSMDRETAGLEILRAVSLVIEAKWYSLLYPGREPEETHQSVFYSGQEEYVKENLHKPDKHGLQLTNKAYASAQIERHGQLIASPVCYQGDALAVILLQMRPVIDDAADDCVNALWRMSNEAALVLKKTNFIEDLENDKVDLNELLKIAERNL